VRLAVTRTIDVHHHILPEFFFRETNDAHNPVGGIAPPPWDADLMLSYMDEAGSTSGTMRARGRSRADATNSRRS
jgi:hypothetical protein